MTHPTNTLIVLLDGAADERIGEFDGKTPLEHASKPFIDSIATEGTLGCTEARGYTHLFMLEFLGGREMNVPRGVIEMLGLGAPLGPDEVAYRLSPARLNDHRIEWEYQITLDDQSKLRRLADKHVRSIAHLDPRLYFYCEGKGLLKVRSDAVESLPSPPAPCEIENPIFGELDPFVKAMSRENDGLVAMPWGGGRLGDQADRSPLTAAKGMTVFSKSPSVLGVAAFLGLDTHRVSDYADGLENAISQLEVSNVIWHVEETDDVSHRRLPRRKTELIKEVDRLLEDNKKALEGYKVAFIVDHGTSSITGQHLIMNVPFAVGYPGKGAAERGIFRETSAGFVPLSLLLEKLLR